MVVRKICSFLSIWEGNWGAHVPTIQDHSTLQLITNKFAFLQKNALPFCLNGFLAFLRFAFVGPANRFSVIHVLSKKLIVYKTINWVTLLTATVNCCQFNNFDHPRAKYNPIATLFIPNTDTNTFPLWAVASFFKFQLLP